MRSSDAKDGLWARTKYSRATLSGVKNKYAMLQIGADSDHVTEDGRMTLGLAFDYTDDSVTFNRGDGHAYRYGLSFYDTWRANSGWYTDAVLKVGVISSKMQSSTASGLPLNTRFRNSFGSASLEAGRLISWENGCFIEPQAQFQLSVIDGADFSTRSGVKGDQSSVKSAAGRLGFRAGRAFEDNGQKGHVYLKADVLHEFAGDRTMRAVSADGLDSIKRSVDGNSTWYDAGLGVNFHLGKNAYLWADAEGVFGGGYGSAWQASAGVRWKF